MPFTTIRITTKTRDDLKKIGKKGEEYEGVIKRLINFYKQELEIRG